ncbi:MAG: VCBS repeat-containing protein [Verrucomicrobiales bacterium]|nr:VCBS repeat-containing protein [Verrucomicrobiales bacterium]
MSQTTTGLAAQRAGRWEWAALPHRPARSRRTKSAAGSRRTPDAPRSPAPAAQPSPERFAVAFGAALALLLPVEAASAAWEDGPGYRRLPLEVPSQGGPGFTTLPVQLTGVTFTNHLAESRYLENINLLNGSGVALGDFDGDGRCDVYLGGLERPGALYRNLGGFRFQDVAVRAGADCAGQASTGAAFADVNGDGHLDLLVNSMGGPNALLVNDGRGRFTNFTAAAGLVSSLGSTSLALADVDGDGDLDLYVANYGVNSILRSGGHLSFRYVSGRPVPTGRHAKRIRVIDNRIFELGEPDVLHLNDGTGRFTPLPWTGGTFLDEEGRPLADAPWDQSLSVLFHDLNGDRAPDVYVCGDASTPDRLWLNDGRGRFRAVPEVAIRQTPYFSMSVVAADLDRDGHDDLFVTDMLSRQHLYALTQRGTMHDQPRLPGDLTSRLQQRRNMLLRARGDGTFAELAWFAGVAGSEWAWSCLSLDVDLDGWEDLLISNGFLHNVDDLDTQERIRNLGRLTVAESRQTALLFERLDTANLAFHNQRDLTFRERGRAWGFDSLRVSNGMALGDLDGDGDLDLVINCLNDGALVLRNDTSAPRLAVRLRGRPPNTQGIGARIRVSGGPVAQEQEMAAGGRYVSSDEPLRVFATGNATRLTIAVMWRGGGQTVITNAQPNSLYEITEPAPAAPTSATPASSARPTPLFTNVCDQLGHRHVEAPFDDFAQQPLLPYRLSRLGPGIGWLDLDADGLDELVVTGDTGGPPEAFRYAPAANRFLPVAAELPVLPGDGVAVASWVSSAGRRHCLVGVAAQKAGETDVPVLALYAWEEQRLTAAGDWGGLAASAGPVAVADYDGDGDLDVFVGGRFRPGQYPAPVDSVLLRNTDGRLQPDLEATRLLAGIGLVAGACWTDVDGDGFSDLVVACEWGPLRLYRNHRGVLRDESSAWGLAELTGLWTGVTAGDFDGDGRMDLVAGNWGLNSPYRASPAEPLQMLYGDLDNNGIVDVLEAYQVPGLGLAPRRDFDAVAAALPFVRHRFASRRAYAQASLSEVLGPASVRARPLEVTTLLSTVFMNRGQRFEAVPLPSQTQWAPVFGVGVADLDGDGFEDLFLSQNLHATQPDFTRMDAGRGLVLRGDGRGGWAVLSSQESGVALDGEQRGCALGDFDADGRTDLAIAQNGAATGLFHNLGARPGLRVRLAGPGRNPEGVGAQLRLRWGDRLGPARELHAGSGYGSQDSLVPVLATPEPPSQLWVRWPGGAETETPVPPGATAITVHSAGSALKN